MKYAVCNVPVSPLRKECSHAAEMISQQLFGECCTVLENNGSWVKIKCSYDNYEGWCQSSHLTEIEEGQFNKQSKKLTNDWLGEVSFNAKKMFIPMGSSLSLLEKNKSTWQDTKVIFKGKKYSPDKVKVTDKLVKFISKKYLNTSYLWGGRSVFGIDCSGFTQSVYKFLNVYLPRDSGQQAELGTEVENLMKSKCGDLCFFDNEEGRIIHVGMLLNKHTIIHSSGKVRIDKISSNGIINSETNVQSHKLKSIRRYF